MNYFRLQELRETNDWKQSYVAYRLNISQRAYSHYENGTRSIPTELLSPFASLYHTSVDYLLERTDIKTPYPKSAGSN